jgi:hypothetical protein
MQSIKLNGREVENPIARMALGTAGICLAVFGILVSVFGILFGIIVSILGITLVIITAPLWLVCHIILVQSGRRGFIHYKKDGSMKLTISSKGFKKKKISL